MRRAAVGPYFSTANIRRLQPVLDAKVRICIERLKGLTKTGEVVKCAAMTSAFSAGKMEGIQRSRN